MALPVRNPTYILAPNWTFPPDGPIALGNIIADPLRPHLVLARPDPAKPQPATATITEKDWKLAREGGQKVSLSLWVNFLEHLSLKVGGRHSSRLRTEYSIDTLETTYFRDGVTADLVIERAKDPVVTAMMRPESVLSKPVYMVTGIKVARGFRLDSELQSEYGGQLGATSPTGGPASAGGEGGYDADKTQSYAFAAANDIVFAYQLVKIAPKGWGKNKGIVGTEYQSAASFLGDEGGDDDDDVAVEIEFKYFTTIDLDDAGKKSGSYEEKKGEDADSKKEYSYVFSKKG